MKTQEAITRARSWHESPGIRPEPATAKAVAAQLLEHIDGLTKIATGELRHVYNGECPDRVEGPNVRDPDCPAYQVLLACGPQRQLQRPVALLESSAAQQPVA